MRPPRRNDEENGKRNNWSGSINKNKNVARMGGGGLSLQSFANAKSRVDGYNPALIKKKREFYKNAKHVSNFKKLLKQEHPRTDSSSTIQSLQGKHPYSLEEAYEMRKREEREEARKERETMLKAKTEEWEKLKEQRKDKKGKMLKKKREEKEINPYSLEGLYKRKCEEEEKAQKEREAMFQAKNEERKKKEDRRKDLKAKMLKKTRYGQPVMKYKIESMLQTIEKSYGS